MKNLINETPTRDLHGRPKYNTKFVDNEDLNNKDFLDIGCGFGWMLLDALDNNAKNIVGIELTEEDIKASKSNIQEPKVKLLTGSAIKLPFENNSFDTITSWEVIEHIPVDTENKMFQEVHRVLRPSGTFYLSTPYDHPSSKIFDPAWWLIKHRHYSREKLNEFAKRNGFSVEKMIVNGGWWEILWMNNLYICKWIFRRRPIFKNYIDQKQDLDYSKENGFTNIFVKFRKI